MAIQTAQQNETTAAKSPTVETNGHHGHDQQQATRNGADPLSPLARAAEAGDAEAFVAAYQAINWTTRTADEFERAIQWALAAGAHLAARALATTGAAQYPDDAELQKAARILAPPKFLRRLPADPTIRANHEWLRNHRMDYHGQWVALRNGQLLANGDSLQALTAVCEISPEILFTKVF
ncbi:MAG: hypothetical protein KDE53_17545 [Caldilineaceae bacterium]|nr:hypothetical protein [Caldilineaceae bacterium]MCB0122970.1 hypothetical protein [Caldilineaceae bacterium]